MGNGAEKDILRDKFGQEQMLKSAQSVLTRFDQTEEEFLGAQAVLMIHGQL